MLSVLDPMADSQFPGPNRVAIPRPQVGIERLPSRHATNEPRESMNCKSCRKRKIKCNRLRPSCEACQLFQCPCVYDAVPKKRGPKTDVLEALLKRVDGLEAKLKEKNTDDDTDALAGASSDSQSAAVNEPGSSETPEPPPKRIANSESKSPHGSNVAVFAAPPNATPTHMEPPTATMPIDALLNTYFSRCHGKPHFIVDETSIRQRHQLNQLPSYLSNAISAVAARYTPHPHGHLAAVRLSEDFMSRSRNAINVDEPSIEALQALLLLVTSLLAAGKGKRAFMAMANAVGMATALELNRELDVNTQVTPAERESRRRIFWTCYLLDRFMASGSKRPSLISDDSIVLRLPSWSSKPSSAPAEGELFNCGSNLQYLQGTGKKSQGSNGMLIDITRILGITNRYLAAGGVKGDSHFPWHSLSSLSKIRQELDVWASGTNNVFASVSSLFGQPDSTVLVLSKLLYHLIHCLIYRPFLPIDLAELSGNGQHQSWQIEATTLCFLHANAIAELVELSRQVGRMQLPMFAGFVVSTAATVHVHGAHYTMSNNSGDMSVFLPSADFLAREMEVLNELRYLYVSVEHQRASMQDICSAHTELVKALATNSIRYTPGFQLEDFFDRYCNIGGQNGQGSRFDVASLALKDISAEFMSDPFAGQVLLGPPPSSQQPTLKRKNTALSAHARPELLQSSAHSGQQGTAQYHNRSLSTQSNPTQDSMHHSQSVSQQYEGQTGHHVSAMRSTMEGTPVATSAPSFGFSPTSMPTASGNTPLPFTPPYSYAVGPMGGHMAQNMMGPVTPSYDPMFGGLPTNAYSSPAAWQTLDVQHQGNQSGSSATAPSPSTKSNTGSTGTQGDEKDPFLTLLEQLAENEQQFNNGSGELDFFLAGAGSVETR